MQKQNLVLLANIFNILCSQFLSVQVVSAANDGGFSANSPPAVLDIGNAGNSAGEGDGMGQSSGPAAAAEEKGDNGTLLADGSSNGTDVVGDVKEKDGPDSAANDGPKSPIEQMMAKQKEVEDSVQAAEANSQEQMEPPSAKEPAEDARPAGNGPSPQEEKKVDIEWRSMFQAADEDEEAKEQKKSIVATEYLTGRLLNADEAKKVSLITMEHEGYPKFQANAAGGAIDPVRIRFNRLAKCTIRDDDKLKKLILTLMICQDPPKAGKCDGPDNSVMVCYPGKMDPANRGGDNHLSVPNIPNNTLAEICNSEEVMKKWLAAGGKNVTMHALVVNIEEGLIQVANSFNNETQKMTPYPDGCVELDIGTKEAPLVARFQQAKGVAHVNQTQLFEKLANAASLRDQGMESILAMDMLSRFNRSHPLLVFVGPKEAGKCEMTVTVRGDSLMRCKNANCSEVADPELSPDEQKRSLYKNDFADMIPVLTPEDLPEEYRKIIFLENEVGTGRPRAILTTQGWEVPFVVLTKDWTPPNLVVIHPPNAVSCTERGNFDINELLLAYNARPDCYGRLAWGERKIRFRDEMGGQSSVLIVEDAPLKIHGPNGDEFWSTDQFGEPKMLGRGTCSIEAHEIPKPINGKKIMWPFIVNPQKGSNTVRLPASRCTLAIGVYLDDYVLMVPKPVNKNKKPADNAAGQ